MPTAAESVSNGQGSQLASSLAGGIETISSGQTIQFNRYLRRVLPLDGFVFWVRADLLAPSGLNSAAMNAFTLNQVGVVEQLSPALLVHPSSLHHTTINQQDEAESFSLQSFVLTSQEPVDQLNAISPDTLWIGDWRGHRLAFSSRTGFYRQANTYHYKGDSLYPALATQVIDDPATIDLSNLVVSNSLPIWLTLNQYFPLFPSLLVPDNMVPPYAAVHIGEDDTSAAGLSLAPFYDQNGSRFQLVRDRVKVTLYGVRNFMVMDWLDLVDQYTLANPSVMGIMNVPVPRDAKRGQTEFSIIAQKKVVEFEVNYYQARVHNIALQYIQSVIINYNFGGEPALVSQTGLGTGFQVGGTELGLDASIFEYEMTPSAPIPPPIL